MKSNQKKVLVAVPTNGTDGRLRIAGLLKYARSRASWDIHFVCSRTSFNDEEVRDLLNSRLDGCVLAAYTPAVEDILSRKIPTVIMLENMHEQIGNHPNCVSVLMDNGEIGRIAAEHFKSLGRFASYAFIPASPKIPWSLERKDAFFGNAPGNAEIFEYPESEFDMDNMTGEAGIQMHVEELVDFLKKLPRPAAVFAANDILAVQVARACHESRIRIPSEIALIGCDNDELLCEGVRPTIASIIPGFEKAGYVAAKTLASMMRGKMPAGSTMRIPGAVLVQRNSTSNLPPAVAVVNAAMVFIKAHAHEGISTSDVIAKLHVSRALLNLRFRQLRRESVMDAILAIRLDAVRERLKSTNKTLLAIGAECGFRSPDYLKRLFKKRFGMSMREWRCRHNHSR